MIYKKICQRSNSVSETKETDSKISVNPSSEDHVMIKMERWSTQGLAPHYSIRIYEDGTVLYEGFKNVRLTGNYGAKLSKTCLDQLVNEFINIYYFALKDKYGGESRQSGLPIVTTSILLDKRTKTIVHYTDCITAPKGLSDLEDKIDSITNSSQWTGLT